MKRNRLDADDEAMCEAREQLEVERLMERVIRDTVKYDEERISRIGQIVRDLFRRFENKPLTMFCFNEVLNGFPLGDNYDLSERQLQEVFLAEKEVRERSNPQQDLLVRWRKIWPTDAEKKIVWSALEKCGFLRMTKNQSYDRSFTNPLWSKKACLYEFTHEAQYPNVTNVDEW